MRFRLRTLTILMAVVPPTLAALWFWLPDVMLWLALFFLAITVACAIVVMLSVPLAMSWIFYRSVKLAIRAFVSPKNGS